MNWLLALITVALLVAIGLLIFVGYVAFNLFIIIALFLRELLLPRGLWPSPKPTEATSLGTEDPLNV